MLYHVSDSPRTDDAEVFANFIGIAPQAEGPIVRLNVRDNQFVKKGELLYEIDERPYEYALEKALSEQAALEGQIVDEQRRINALVSSVSVAKANISSSQADVARSEAAVEQARADVANAEQGVSRAKAEWTYASNNLHRLEPLARHQHRDHHLLSDGPYYSRIVSPEASLADGRSYHWSRAGHPLPNIYPALSRFDCRLHSTFSRSNDSRYLDCDIRAAAFLL